MRRANLCSPPLLIDVYKRQLSDMDATPSDNKIPPVLINDKVGFASAIRDEEGIYETTTLHREIAKYLNNRDEREESIRLLYVALTRARDKLILVTSAKKILPEDFEYYTKRGSSTEKGVSFLFSKKIRSLDGFIFSSLAYHPNIRGDFPFPSVGLGEQSPITVNLVRKTSDNVVTERVFEGPIFDIEKIKKQISFHYDTSLFSVPAKISVTELVKNRFREENDGDLLIAESLEVKTPEFVDGKRGGTYYGNATHRYLSYADLRGDFEEEKARLISTKRLTEDEASVLKKDKIESFLKSSVGRCLLNADRVLREEDFVVSVPASFYDGKAGEGEMLLQGAMDALCEFSDGFVLIDYKTDRKTEAELIDKYAFQLYLYSVAAEKMFSKKVKKAFIWSFSLEKGIDVTPFFPEKG